MSVWRSGLFARGRRLAALGATVGRLERRVAGLAGVDAIMARAGAPGPVAGAAGGPGRPRLRLVAGGGAGPAAERRADPR